MTVHGMGILVQHTSLGSIRVVFTCVPQTLCSLSMLQIHIYIYIMFKFILKEHLILACIKHEVLNAVGGVWMFYQVCQPLVCVFAHIFYNLPPHYPFFEHVHPCTQTLEMRCPANKLKGPTIYTPV